MREVRVTFCEGNEEGWRNNHAGDDAEECSTLEGAWRCAVYEWISIDTLGYESPKKNGLERMMGICVCVRMG